MASIDDTISVYGSDLDLTGERGEAITKITGFPAHRFGQPDFDGAAWTKLNWPDIRFKGTLPVHPQARAARSTWVSQITYTPTEARIAKDRLHAAVGTGALTTRAAIAYKSHITRRTTA